MGLGGRGFRLGFLGLFLRGDGLCCRWVMVGFVMGVMLVGDLVVFIMDVMLEKWVIFMREFRLDC